MSKKGIVEIVENIEKEIRRQYPSKKKFCLKNQLDYQNLYNFLRRLKTRKSIKFLFEILNILDLEIIIKKRK